MQTAEALTLFASIQARPFTMTHCWNILKNEVKWLDLQNTVKEKEGRGRTQNAADGANIVDVDGSSTSPPSGLGKRPIGRDRAKESKKRSSSSSQSQESSSEFVSSMHDMHLEKITLMKSIEERKAANKEFMMKVEAERIAMERERLEMPRNEKRHMEEERILAIDLNNCNPVQRMYFLARQAEILARYAAGSGSGMLTTLY